MKIALLSFAMLALFSCAAKRSSLLPLGLAGPLPAIDERHAIVIEPTRVELTKAYFKEHNREHYELIKELEGEAALQITPRLIVVHYTALPTLEETLAYFKPSHIASDRGAVTAAGALNVGIQFVVDRDGSIYRQYPETAAARHVIGLNHVAIGIENVGNADLGACGANVQALTKAQLAANARLVRYLAGAYPSLRHIIGHNEYQDLERPDHPAHDLFREDVPGYRTKKVDPGPRFMKKLRRLLSKSRP
jgi:N-acetylmuramoyl-L-alanine amidase